MTTTPWIRGRGFGRLLAQETNISDLLQFLSDQDSSPWADLVGFIPVKVERESHAANNADLLLVGEEEKRAAVEVKLGHIFGVDQQKEYEGLDAATGLYLAALGMDRARLDPGTDSRWQFLDLVQVFDAWTDTDDKASRTLAREVVDVLRKWDFQLTSVFASSDEATHEPLKLLSQKFLARVVTRRIAVQLRDRGWLASAGVTSGGGLPLVQAWTPIRGEEADRSFIAEVRWWETKQGGELRFGVDFDPRPNRAEDEEVRRSAYQLARDMENYIDFAALRDHLAVVNPRLAGLLSRKSSSRPTAKGDWERVIVHGFAGATLPGGVKNNRQRTRPAFYGDGTLRFQAIVEIDYAIASAQDITELLDTTLTYLAEAQPTEAFR